MSTEVKNTSWGSRVGNAFKGVVTGIILVVVAIGVLFWNEGRTIKRTKALREAGENAVSIDSQPLDPSFDGKLVHISGDVVTDDVLNDPDFGVSLNALKLVRKAEMYQWQEDVKTTTRRTSGGGEEETTTYSYKKVWSEKLIDSSSFHDPGYDNPLELPFESQNFLAQNATLGEFALSEAQIDALGPDVVYDVNKKQPDQNANTATAPRGENDSNVDPSVQPQNATTADPKDLDSQINVPVEPSQPEASGQEDQKTEEEQGALRIANTEERFAQNFTISTSAPSSPASSFSVNGSAEQQNVGVYPSVAPGAAPAQTIYVVGSIPATDSKIVPFKTGYYVGNPSAPQIGDVKISFSYVATPCPTSFVAQQEGNSLVPYQAKTGSVLLQSPGILTLGEMIENAHRSNMLTAWLIRLAGLFFIFVGLKMIFAPLEVLVDIIPVASSILGIGTSLVAFCGTLFLGLGSISIGWLYYRPVVGIPLLVVAIISMILPFLLGKKKGKEVAV